MSPSEALSFFGENTIALSGPPYCLDSLAGFPLESPSSARRDGRVAEGARLESVFRGNSNVGSNPTLSAKIYINKIIKLADRCLLECLQNPELWWLACER